MSIRPAHYGLFKGGVGILLLTDVERIALGDALSFEQTLVVLAVCYTRLIDFSTASARP